MRRSFTIDTCISYVKGIDDNGLSLEREMWDATLDQGVRSYDVDPPRCARMLILEVLSRKHFSPTEIL